MHAILTRNLNLIELFEMRANQENFMLDPLLSHSYLSDCIQRLREKGRVRVLKILERRKKVVLNLEFSERELKQL